jgi:hypothetical protein
MKRTPAAMILATAVLFAPWACGAGRFPTHDQLNDASRGVWSDDTADVLKPRQLLYETKEDGRYRVGYNLIRQSAGDVKGYFVRLTIKNLSQSPTTASAEISLVDAENTVIPATDREAFLGLAKTLTDTKIPTETLKTRPAPPSGSADFLQAYLRGQAEGAVVKANTDIATGRKMTVWADSFWLRPTLELPPLGRVSGVRVFLTEPYHPLPLTLRVKLGESLFEFTTRAK